MTNQNNQAAQGITDREPKADRFLGKIKPRPANEISLDAYRSSFGDDYIDAVRSYLGIAGMAVFSVHLANRNFFEAQNITPLMLAQRAARMGQGDDLIEVIAKLANPGVKFDTRRSYQDQLEHERFAHGVYHEFPHVKRGLLDQIVEDAGAEALDALKFYETHKGDMKPLRITRQAYAKTVAGIVGPIGERLEAAFAILKVSKGYQETNLESLMEFYNNNGGMSGLKRMCYLTEQKPKDSVRITPSQIRRMEGKAATAASLAMAIAQDPYASLNLGQQK